MLKYLFSLLFTFFISSLIVAQIVTIDPTFPSRDELITITYDATQGSGGLIDVPQVYMHTGLITNTSSSGSDWKYVVGNWGTDDAKVKMTNIGDNKHQISIVINDFYSVPMSVMIDKLAFVFRNVDGSKEGKTASGQDIFIDYFESMSFTGFLITPTQPNVIASIGDTIPIEFATNQLSTISISDNTDLIYSQENTNLVTYDYIVNDADNHLIQITANNGEEDLVYSFNLMVRPEVSVEILPNGSLPGINKLSQDSFRLVFLAPQKEYVYVIGDFNDWSLNNEYFMKRSPDNQYFWLDIIGLDPSKNYAFQYLVDGSLVTADPFSEIVLDQNNDQFISNNTYPNLHPYPHGKTNGYVSLLKTGAEDYQWQHDFEHPASADLVIYELLMRDFTNEKNYQTLIDTLDYLKRLGINAIEFMPVNEFEGNQSWGYNPAYHMALDKYYGSPESFKSLIDECHKRGIAVILDVVYNHAFSQSPFARMYWDSANSRPSADSPFLNTTAMHLYNVGYDFNHESPYTRLFVERVIRYWISEYHIDGFRFDLSKGFTQKATTTDAAFAAYDQSRIDILKNYADNIWDLNPNAYVILEHFAANNEEKALIDYGMMVWGNLHYAYGEAALGYNANGSSNFEWIDYKKRGLSTPGVVGYMESHDEERLMYQNLNFGNSTSTYNIKDLKTALERIELVSAFFYTMPGPKMLWQFGELGYDFSINRCENGSIDNGCRLSPKPIRWDYKDDINRKKLLDIISALTKFKTKWNITKTNTYSHNLSTEKKVIKLNSDTLNAIIIGNFEVGSRSLSPGFQHTGTWYDYFSGDSIIVSNPLTNLVFKAGEYRIYTDRKLGDSPIISSIEDTASFLDDYNVFPNPASNHINLHLKTNNNKEVVLMLLDSEGRITKKNKLFLNAGENNLQIDITDMVSGLYYIQMLGTDFKLIDRIVIQH